MPSHPLFRPRWIAGHLLALVTVVAFINLGMWQLRRHAEALDLRDAVAEAQAMPIVPVEDAGMHRRVVAFGEYDASAQVRVLRSEGGVSGYVLLTPLVLSDGTAILVNRGWVPPDLGDGDIRQGDGVSLRPPEGRVRTEGYLWPAEPGSWRPDALEPNQVVRRIDPAVVDPFTTYPFRDGYMIEALLRADAPPALSLGPHLAYAGQWFLFSLIVVAGYPLLLRRVVRRRR